MDITSGSFRLFRVRGIDVFLHWTWFLIAFIQIVTRPQEAKTSWTYEQPAWFVVEYLCLFGIVLLHEFSHALACRSVGGLADTIVLWPLGGIAYVRPPARPGAVLWSIAAGPLVNVALVLPTVGLYLWSAGADEPADLNRFFFRLVVMNGLLLAFNLLPVYPLDGRQSLQAILRCGV